MSTSNEHNEQTSGPQLSPGCSRSVLIDSPDAPYRQTSGSSNLVAGNQVANVPVDSEHRPEPNADLPDGMMAVGKYRWWIQPATVGELANPKIALLLTLMSRIPRPTNPGESLCNGYLRNSRFHDGEPQILLDALLALDPTYFEAYPTRNMMPLDRAGMKGACGEAACAFLRWRPGYKMRGTRAVATPDGAYDAAIEKAITQAQARAHHTLGADQGLQVETEVRSGSETEVQAEPVPGV